MYETKQTMRSHRSGGTGRCGGGGEQVPSRSVAQPVVTSRRQSVRIGRPTGRTSQSTQGAVAFARTVPV